MTADLTPAQATRLEANPVDRLLTDVLIALWATDRPQVLIARDLGISTKHLSMIRQGHAEPSLPLLRRMCALLAVAAVDVMRGAADEGAVGRVLALADEFGDLAALAQLRAFRARSAEMPGQANIEQAKSDAYDHAAHLARVTVGAPATAEGDDGAEWTASLAICPVCAARDSR